jgi:L-fuculose-phosphate aldolase
MDNDGVLVVGGDVLETFDRLEVLETTAEAILQASALGPIQPMPDEAIEELRQAFLKD